MIGPAVAGGQRWPSGLIEVEQLSALAAMLREKVSALLSVEREVGAASKTLSVALQAGRDGLAELDAVEAAVAAYRTIEEEIGTLADPLSALLSATA